MSDHIRPDATFYLSAPVENIDGTVDRIDVDGMHAALTTEAAIAHATEQIEDSGGVYIVYECRPIKRLTAYRVKIEDIASAT